ncbi:MAG: hypothetical protein OXU98_09525, partial [Gammaproteobacteria bacterium]|nr:hypothetical protein [Gammaproteobacteria bacterium]
MRAVSRGGKIIGRGRVSGGKIAARGLINRGQFRGQFRAHPRAQPRLNPQIPEEIVMSRFRVFARVGRRSSAGVGACRLSVGAFNSSSFFTNCSREFNMKTNFLSTLAAVARRHFS